MKKKLLFCLAPLALVALVSCDSKLSEETDFKSLKSEKLSSNEWANALSFDKYQNFTLKINHSQNSVRLSSVNSISNKSILTSYSYNSKEEKSYIEFTDTYSWQYVDNGNGEFTKYVNGETPKSFEEGLQSGNLLPNFKESYSKFSYDNEKKSYISFNFKFYPDSERLYDLEVKFQDDRLAYIKANDTEYFYYNYDSTTFELPKTYKDTYVEVKNKEELEAELSSNEIKTIKLMNDFVVDSRIKALSLNYVDFNSHKVEFKQNGGIDFEGIDTLVVFDSFLNNGGEIYSSKYNNGNGAIFNVKEDAYFGIYNLNVKCEGVLKTVFNASNSFVEIKDSSLEFASTLWFQDSSPLLDNTNLLSLENTNLTIKYPFEE